MPCAEHAKEVLLCCCGYTRDPFPKQVLEPRTDWDEERVKKEYRLMGKLEQALYVDWLKIAKPYEKQPLQAAQFATQKILERRRRLGAGGEICPSTRT